MAGQFTMTAEQMHAFSARMVEVNGLIQGEIGRLHTLVDGVPVGWQGAASTAYQQLQQTWNEDAAALNKVLDEIRQAIDRTARNYAVTEDRQRSNLGAVGGA
jgi:WXG100 family type VII secretion target